MIECPANIVVDCSKALDPVDFTVSAHDDAGAELPVVCSPAPGTVFSPGANRVVCTATEGRVTATCSFLVDVADTTPPTLDCPSNLVVQATSTEGAVAGWRVSARDECGEVSAVTCRPPSGSVFKLGATAVNCLVSDAAGNMEQCAFLVTVTPPPPLRIARSGSNSTLVLRWTGNQALQGKAELRRDLPWVDSTLPVEQAGGEQTVLWPDSGRSHFFRLRPVPFPDTRDSDRDGVPDSRDRCPETPRGVTVDEFGCSAIDVARTPERLLEPVQKRWAEAAGLAATIATNPNPPFASADLSGVKRYADLAQSEMKRAQDTLGLGDLCPGADAYESALIAWNNAWSALEGVVRAVAVEWAGREPSPSEEGDVSPEAGYMIQLENLSGEIQRAHEEGMNTLPAVQSVCIGLVDGSLIAGRAKKLDDQVLEYVDPAGLVRRWAVKEVAYFFTRPLPPDLRQALAKGQQKVCLLSGDEIEGTIAGLSGGQLTIDSVLFGRKTQQFSKVQAVCLRPRQPGGRFSLSTRDGSVYQCATVTADEGLLSAEGRSAGTLTVQAADLVEVRCD